MKYYVELTLLPDADISLYYLWEKVYQQLHLALVEQKEPNNKVKVGVSFPEYNLEKHQLGNSIRFFSDSKDKLAALDLSRWLARFTDYVHIKSIRKVPERITSYGCFKRVFSKGSNESLARRRAKKLSITYEAALAYFENDKDRKQSQKSTYRYPFITMKSLHTAQKYPLSIALSVVDTLYFGDGFSTYGLSSDSSVPLF